MPAHAIETGASMPALGLDLSLRQGQSLGVPIAAGWVDDERCAKSSRLILLPGTEDGTRAKGHVQVRRFLFDAARSHRLGCSPLHLLLGQRVVATVAHHGDADPRWLSTLRGVEHNRLALGVTLLLLGPCIAQMRVALRRMLVPTLSFESVLAHWQVGVHQKSPLKVLASELASEVVVVVAQAQGAAERGSSSRGQSSTNHVGEHCLKTEQGKSDCTEHPSDARI
mmetsp:Transcript_94057/g.130640  ORF Transcript_94057/g.130640 Transcript_94057/m.130640 type:complete len:225 (-) Transcript_94057:7-681(-)